MQSVTRNVTSICHRDDCRQMYVVCPKKHGKKKVITSFHRRRIIHMRKRRKLAKSHIFVSEKTAQILHVKELICESHRQEKLHDEEIAVTKNQDGSKLFLQICKKTYVTVKSFHS